MNGHNLFYYPYASLTNSQLPLLKVAALYFDKLYILDPVGASWDTIGADFIAREAILLLEKAGILEIVTPQTVLEQFSSALEDSIRKDLRDTEFLKLCEIHSLASNKQRWTLSLEKVPENLQTDQNMRRLLGDFARGVSSEAGRFSEQLDMYAKTGEVYNEGGDGYDGAKQYRYVEFPLALGEAIMMNHALFTGLLYKGATPITDDPFHNQVLLHKLKRALREDAVIQEPRIQQAIANQMQKKQMTADWVAGTALADSRLNLPILDPQFFSLEDILDYRSKNNDGLQGARYALSQMAGQIKSELWSKDFAVELKHTTIPNLVKELDAVRKAQDGWLHSSRGQLALQAAGVAAGTAAAVLTVFTAPITPVALLIAGLSLTSGTAVPITQWFLERDRENALQENGLHYLLKV